jgi:hypothetical protein
MPKTIKDIVSVRSEAALVKGVQLGWYEEPQQEQENRRLATGYIFSSGKGTPEARLLPAITIFEKIRESLNQPSSFNVFSVIAKYGHGKSHFALVLANYFGRQLGDPVLEGILAQVEACSNANTAYHFRSFKENSQKPQLVICMSGADFTDLRQGFMQAVRRALQRHEQSRNYAIRSVSLRAATWLESLGAEQKARAERYLVEQHGVELEALIQRLGKFDLSMESIARELSKFLLGVPADFGAELNLRDVITQLADDLCTGKDAPFSKMVILFDELGIYAEKWCHNKMAAGGFAPQQIIEACDSRRGRVCLVGFLQREMGEFVKQYSMQDEFRKWADRFPKETCFSLEASLEKVIEGLLTKLPAGKQLLADFRPQIERACDAAWRILPYYQQRPDAWQESSFRSTVGLGTVPFHPITTGLLCNLEFVQGERTIIGFVEESIRRVSDEPAVKDGSLNWILPISLVDEFKNNFEGYSDRFALYTHAQRRLGHNVDPDYYMVLKALFLFDVGLKRYPSQSHESVLAEVCGLSEDRLRELLKHLEEEYFVIRYLQARKEYEFAGVGTSPIEIRQQLQSEIAGKKIASLAQSVSVLDVFPQITLPESEASEFKAEHAVEGDEWRLSPRLLDASKLEVGTVRRFLLDLDEKGAERGLLICLISKDGVELDTAKTVAHRVLDEIKCSEHSCPVAIAVPKSPALTLEREILLRDALQSWGEEKRKLYGEGFEDAMKDATRRVEDALRGHLKDLSYVVPSIVDQRLKAGESTRLERISDRLFESSFPSRVPARSNIMKTSSSSGNAAVAEIARHLILNEMDYGKLDQKAHNLVTTVLSEGHDRWGILNSKHRLQTPTNPHVLKSWEELEQRVNSSMPVPFKSLSTVLRAIPYGHDDFTLTLLYASWIGMNKHDLAFTGRVEAKEGRPPTLSIQEIQSQLKKARDFTKWLDSGEVKVCRPSIQHREKARDFLERVKQATTLERARSLILQSNGIQGGLSPEEQLARDVAQAANGLRLEVSKLERYGEEVRKYVETIEKTKELPALLQLAENPPQIPQSSLEIQDEPSRRAKSAIDNKVLSLVELLTQQPLKDIEAYDALRRDLDSCQLALENSGRENLKVKCISARARINTEYAQLKAKQKDLAILAELNALHIEDLGLGSSRNAAARIRTQLVTDLSDSSAETQELAKEKLGLLDIQVTKYTDWLSKLPQRFSEVGDSKTARMLREDLVSKAQRYANTPELAGVEQWKVRVVEAERRFEEIETLEAARRATVSTFVRLMKHHAGRVSNARAFADAAGEYGNLTNPESVPQGIEFTRDEQREVDALRLNARERLSTFFAKVKEPRPLKSATSFALRQAELEEVLAVISGSSDLPAEWRVEIETMLNQVVQAHAQWQAEQERDLEEQKRANAEKQRRRDNLEVLKEVMKQATAARTLTDIEGALATIASAPSRLSPPCEEELTELSKEGDKLGKLEVGIRSWVSDSLPPALSKCWDPRAIKELKKAIVGHGTLCASSAEITALLSDASVALDQRLQLLDELLRLERQCSSLKQCAESLERLAQLKDQHPDATVLTSQTETKIRGRVEFLQAENRRKIEIWLSQFQIVLTGTFSPTEASDLLRKLEVLPVDLNREDEIFVASVRAKLTLARDADLAVRIADDFAKLETPEQRYECFLRIAQICKRQGLLSEYIEKLHDLV